MGTLSGTEIIRTLQTRKISLFSLADFARLFGIGNRQTLYKRIQGLEKDKIIRKLIKGKYRFLLGPTNDFATANFICQPSYISLESALSFYGMITGFTYQITSMTTGKTRTVTVDEKEFKYSQIAANLFWGYEKTGDFLMAEKEKALLDYIYLGLKGLRSLSFDEFDLSAIDKRKLAIYTKKFDNERMAKEIKRIIL